LIEYLTKLNHAHNVIAPYREDKKRSPLVWVLEKGVTESSYELQFRIYPKVSLTLSFKNLIKEDSYLKSATLYLL